MPEAPSVRVSPAPARPFRVGSDGLPLLPCHAPVSAFPAAPALRVTQFGHEDSNLDIRNSLLARYRHSDQSVSEMTLRIDTELEILRRSCFARRNAQWGNVTPDQFQFVPVPSGIWAPPVANPKAEVKVVEGKSDGPQVASQEAPEYVRERAWPPKEFALKPLVKPRGKAGRKKTLPMAAVVDPVPLLARTCKECGTQSSALWRKQNRSVTVTRPKPVVPGTVVKPGEVEMQLVQQQVQVDLCLPCFLKLERKDLFSKKAVEKRKQERRKKDQSAALMERKRLKEQIHVLQHQKEVKEEQPPEKIMLKFTREEIEAATGTKERKRDRKHRKDKKKKKKHRHRHEESESEGPTPLVSPAQMDDFVYADRAPEPYATPSTSVFDLERSLSTTKPEAAFENGAAREIAGYDHGSVEPAESTSVRSSSRKRKSVNRTSPARSIESPGSASKKRRASSSRPKRASAPEIPVVAPAAPLPAVQKRSRTKKELERERELRALGQYCPVCSEVYEDDDPNTFVCCDSCELWVHGACDPTLTPASIAAMANTDDKYICPLCGGR